MKAIIAVAAVFVLGLVTFLTLRAGPQDKSKRPSPPATAQCALANGKNITVDYSSPRAKGRKVYGGLVPYGEVWRAGANEATTFVTTADLMVGGTHVPAGSYTLYVIPNAEKWTLVISKKTGQWGTPYPGADSDFARRAKAAGYRLWFAPGNGVLRVRMYRSFGAMWQGWKKNLYRLMGGTPWAVFRELESVFPWMPVVILLLGLKYPFALLLGVWLIIFRQMSYGSELRRNQFPFRLILYYVPAVALYAGVLWASCRAYARGRVQWKGREVAVGVASKNAPVRESP